MSVKRASGLYIKGSNLNPLHESRTLCLKCLKCEVFSSNVAYEEIALCYFALYLFLRYDLL